MHKSFVERSPVIYQVLKTEQNMGFSEKSKMGKISFNLAICLDCIQLFILHIHFAESTLQLNAKISWNDFLSHNTPLITAWVNEMQFFKKQIETFFSF